MISEPPLYTWAIFKAFVYPGTPAERKIVRKYLINSY